MKLRLKIFAATFMLCMSFGVLAGAPSVSAQFDPLQEACEQNPEATACQENQEGQDGDNPISGPSGIITGVINVIAVATAVISTIIIVVAGIMMTMSQGDSGKIKTARDAVIYAAVGIIVVALARSIVVFIINKVN